MWGFTTRGVRLGGGNRASRLMQHGLARAAVRGPAEHAVLELSGEWDFSNAEQMVDSLEHVPHRIAAIDAAHLEFIDGSGARALDALLRRFSRDGEWPQLIGLTPSVRRTLTLVRRMQDRIATPA